MGQILQKFKYIKCLLKCITCFDFSKLNFKHDLRIRVSNDGYIMHKRNAVNDFSKSTNVCFSICNLPLFSCHLQPQFSCNYDNIDTLGRKAYDFSDYVLVISIEYPIGWWAQLKTLTTEQVEAINKVWNSMYEE